MHNNILKRFQLKLSKVIHVLTDMLDQLGWMHETIVLAKACSSRRITVCHNSSVLGTNSRSGLVPIDNSARS